RTARAWGGGADRGNRARLQLLRVQFAANLVQLYGADHARARRADDLASPLSQLQGSRHAQARADRADDRRAGRGSVPGRDAAADRLRARIGVRTFGTVPDDARRTD